MDTAAELLAQAKKLRALQHQASQQAQSQQPHYVPQQMPNQHQAAEGPPMLHSPDPVSINSQAQQSVQSSSSPDDGAAASLIGHQEVNDDANGVAAQQDMQAVALDIVESQLPLWSSKPALDWSAQQDLSMYQPQVPHFDTMIVMIAVMLLHRRILLHGSCQGHSL